jgi:urease accessory protein
MLSLWSKSLKKPVYLVKGDRREEEADGLMEELRGRIRDGMLEGHQPISWGVLCGVLGLSKGVCPLPPLCYLNHSYLLCLRSFFDRSSERTLHLHLYLHARSILSSSTRLNQIGPYNAQTLLLHTVPPIIDAELAYYLKELWEGDVTISLRQLGADEEEEDDVGPAGVWPLGDLLQSRHDWMHSRMFNT